MVLRPDEQRLGSAEATADRLNRGTRPYNFIFWPLIDATVGYPQGLDPIDCTLIAPFSKDREAWLTSRA